MAPIIKKTNSIEAAKNKADIYLKEAVLALESIPKSKHKEALIELCNMASSQISY